MTTPTDWQHMSEAERIALCRKMQAEDPLVQDVYAWLREQGEWERSQIEVLVKQPLDGHVPTYTERVLMPEPHDYRDDLKRIGETNGFKVVD